jgi:hypothetical protein
VERGLKRRKAVNIPYVGIDEKQFRSGHRYISSLVDPQGGRVLKVVEERAEVACKALISKALTLNSNPRLPLWRWICGRRMRTLWLKKCYKRTLFTIGSISANI